MRATSQRYSRVVALACLKGFGAVLVAAGLLACASAAPAVANETPWWQLTNSTRPAVMQPGSEATVIVRAVNLGDVAITGKHTPVQISDTLPANLTAISAEGTAGTAASESGGSRGELACSLGATVTCTWEGFSALQPYEELVAYIHVHVGSAIPAAENAASISGGGAYRCYSTSGGSYDGPFCGFEEEAPGHYEAELSATPVPTVSLQRPVEVKSGETPFGLSDLALAPELEGGAPDTQAGSHPFQLTTTVAFNESSSTVKPPAFPKGLQVNLPAGLLGNTQSIPQCTESQFADATSSLDDANACPDSSAIGAAVVDVYSSTVGNGAVPTTQTVPVFNLTPGRGEPARFGFEAVKAPIVLDTAVRTGTDYGVITRISNLSQFATPLSATVVLWGVPGDASHNLARGWSCIRGGLFFEETAGKVPACNVTAEANPRPFLRLPTSCTGTLKMSAEVNSWQAPNDQLSYQPAEFGNPMESLEGCARLPFAPEFSLATDTQSTSSPTALTVKLRQSQAANENADGLATADIKATTVALPAGFTLNPASANGLEACSEGQIGFEPGRSSAAEEIFTTTLPSPFCPSAAKVGTVKIKTPILANPLEGAVYLARQNENPFQSLVALYMVAEDPVSGVLLKLPGKVSLNEETGQVTASFENTPQAPIEELEVSFFGGPLAAIATPPGCGSYTTNATITPWSGTQAQAAHAVSNITSGVGGAPCPSGLPFAPSLTGGVANTRAGASSTFTTSISREDGSQQINAISLHLPPGLTGLIASVKPCEEAQANAGTCGSESLIGSASVAAGVGSDPVTVTGGQVFLTGPYEGAPFGLSIVTEAKAGPFDLGQVVVRAKLEIDRHTADVTVATGAIPHILKGVPLELKRINVSIDRSGFALNPTNCQQLSMNGSVKSLEGTVAPVAAPFKVADCATLGFAPKLTASITGHASKAGGVGLTTKLTYPNAPLGTQANISRAKIVLPVQLPTRLSTLHEACTAAVFESDRAACPAASKVGSGIARTPLLPVPLTGSAYLVSHGGEAFPALTVVLEGDNVTYELVGTTLISKGITSESFKTVADVPVSSFELMLPAGEYSLLGVNLPAKDKFNYCGTKLAIPAAFVGQNGAEVHQSNAIGITGCSKAKAVKKAKKKAKKKPSAKKRK
jgi:hypothetical protein